ncbi:MAG: hypothetical protein HY675_26100 [Chloroflexi bacterium]|nr:hypothetical protein [Chloroflexota bacterium]
MARDLDLSVERYVALVDYLPGEEEAEEVMYTFLYRDEVHDALKAGGKLPVPLAERLEEADRKVMSMREDLVRRFPGVFIDRAPREYWWWHLDKGLQVPEKAQDAA